MRAWDDFGPAWRSVAVMAKGLRRRNAMVRMTFAVLLLGVKVNGGTLEVDHEYMTFCVEGSRNKWPKLHLKSEARSDG